MAKEKIGIRFSARAETDLNIQTENESHAVFFYGRSNGLLERGMKRSIVGFQLLHSHQLFG